MPDRGPVAIVRSSDTGVQIIWLTNIMIHRYWCPPSGWRSTLDDPKVRIVESDEDILLYDIGHIPGAVKLDWHTDLQDPVRRDFIDKPGSRR